MVSDNRAIQPQGSPYIPQTHSYGFIEQLHSGNSVRPEELGRGQPQPFYGYHHQQIPHPHPRPYPSPYPYPYAHPSPYAHDMYTAVQREIEKEKIRQDIIMSEIMRRRELEAEVRRELMMERELALQRGSSHGFSFRAPSGTGVDSPRMSLEERNVPLLVDSERLSGVHESRGVEPLPFQGGSSAVINLEVKPVTEVVREKERIDLGACGTKREASKVDASESPSGFKASKKVKSEWSCGLCKVSINSEHALKDHLRGKKHKLKEASMKNGKKCSIGLLLEKPATVDPLTGDGIEKCSIELISNKPATADPLTGNGVKVSTKNEIEDKMEEASMKNGKKCSIGLLLEKPATVDPLTGDGIEKCSIELISNKPATADPLTGNGVKVSTKNEIEDKMEKKKKKRSRFWCDFCKIGAPSQKVMNSHLQGKKHAHQQSVGITKCGENGGRVVANVADEP